MKKITFGFSKPKHWKPFAEAIKLVDNNYFSHAYIKFHSDSLERDLIYQASGTKVNFIGLSRFLEENLVVAEYTFEVTEETYIKILQWCIDSCGLKYSLKIALGLAIYRSLGLKTILLEDKGYVCSVLAATILDDFIDENIDPSIMTPKLLFIYFEQYHKQRRTI